VEAKADAKYPITSAASIAAKVTRDACWLNWTMAEPGLALPDTIGSGYPGDARTKALIEADFNAIFGLPTYARFSWETVKGTRGLRAETLDRASDGPLIAWAERYG
jgi:ribonuclease H2 subunit A